MTPYIPPQPDAKTKKYQNQVNYIVADISELNRHELVCALLDAERAGAIAMLEDVHARLSRDNGLEGTWGRVRMQVRSYWGL